MADTACIITTTSMPPNYPPPPAAAAAAPQPISTQLLLHNPSSSSSSSPPSSNSSMPPHTTSSLELLAHSNNYTSSIDNDDDYDDHTTSHMNNCNGYGYGYGTTTAAAPVPPKAHDHGLGCTLLAAHPVDLGLVSSITHNFLHLDHDTSSCPSSSLNSNSIVNNNVSSSSSCFPTTSTTKVSMQNGDHHEYNYGIHNGNHHEYNHGMDATAAYKSMAPNYLIDCAQALNDHELLPTVVISGSNNNSTSCLSNYNQMERLNGSINLKKAHDHDGAHLNPAHMIIAPPSSSSSAGHVDLGGASSSVDQLQNGSITISRGGNFVNGDIDPSNHATTTTRKAPAAHEQLGRPSVWYEEEIAENLRWSFGLKSTLHAGFSEFQEISLLDTQPFGKVLTLDGKMQSAEVDEWVYHECLVHPALLLHRRPENIFIMGGGEGSAAREVLKHKSIAKVVMCDIDEEVVKFCRACLTTNHEAFESPKLELVINDARLELECRNEKFDIIIGDLSDPLEWGPCYQLYSKGFYENVVKPKLNDDGIFVTQAGPAGVLSHKEVFTSIYNTLKQVFSNVVAYSAHVPSYADTWGWVMASNQPLNEISHHDEMDTRILKRIKGELQYLDGATLHASTILNKTVRQSLASEKHIYTEDSARFLYGHGRSIHISTH